MAEERDSQHAELAESVRKLEKHRTGILLTGRIKDGEVELDERTLKEIADKFAGADRSFLAVNAPFDPTAQLEAPQG